MLKLNDVSFSYNKEKDIIKNFSAEFSKGERVCIKAPSGKGKTTLLRLICSLEKPDSGTIEFSKKPRIGTVFQSDVLLPWKTAEENVAVVSSKESAKQWLCDFGLAEALNKYPDELSGGMNRRVAIARAVSFEPDILILDEAFKGIDTETKEHIMAILKEHFSDRLIIFTSHDESEIESFATKTINL